MSLPADHVDLAQDGTAYTIASGADKIYLRKNVNPAGPITHSKHDNNFELLRLKLNELGKGNNDLKTLFGSTQAAAQSATDAQTAQTAAETAQTNAETAEKNAETAEKNAETAESNAVTAKNASVTAKNASVTAQTAAESAKSNAQTYASKRIIFGINCK